MQQGRTYRADIDGLRAVALLAVLAFDASARWLPGGFAGIDIFFVISGYLISSTVVEDLDRGAYDFRDFYERRLRRLLPALLVVLVASFVLGWFLLFAGEYRALGRDMAGAAVLPDNRVPTRILGHLWAVATLLPFYAVWPLLLGLLRKRLAIIDAVIVALLAFFLAANLSSGWELMAGCGLASLKRRGWQWHGPGADMASVLGVVLLAAGFALGLPGRWVLMPALGALLVLSAGPDAWLSRNLLANPVAVTIGLVSYPLYLWHWPLLAFIQIADSATPSPNERVAALALALLLAGATYQFLERPMRAPRGGPHAGARTVALVASAICVAAIGYGCYVMNGLPGTGYRDAERQVFLDDFAGEKIDAGCTATCTERDPARRRAVLLWGDSHAQELYGGLKRNLPSDWQILQVARPGCFPDATVAGPSTVDPCRHSNWTALQTIAAAKPDVVIVAQDRGQLIRRYNATGAVLKQLGVTRTLFAGPTPHWRTALPTIVARLLWHDTPRRSFVGIDPSFRTLNEILIDHFTTSDAMAFVDIMGVFCNEQGCLTYLGDDRRTGLTSGDGAHLRAVASDYLAQQVLVRMVVGSVKE